MKINKQNLLIALEIVKPGLASKELIEQSTSFCFISGSVVTYNDRISVSCPVEDLELEGAVNATELYAYIKKVKQDEITAEIEDSEILLKAGRSKVGLTLHEEIVLPVKEIGEIKKWKKLPDDFAAGLHLTMGSCSRNMSDPVLTCVHINKDRLEGSDNMRISDYTLISKVPVKAFLLPADTCAQVVKMVPSEIAAGEGWVHFRSPQNGAVLSCRIFEEEYPDVKQFLDVEGIDITFPKNLPKLIDKAGIFSKRDHTLDETIEIKIESNKLFVSSKSDSGWFKESVRILYKGDDIEFSITPYLLQDILKQTFTGVISDNCLLFKGENWNYVSLLKD